MNHHQLAQSFKIIVAFALVLVGRTDVSACEMKIGWEPWPPFQYENQQGVVTGLDIELLNTVLKRMQCKPTYLKIKWAAHLQRVRNGSLDIAASASWSEDREAYAYFSKSYRTEEVGLFVRKGESTSFRFKILNDIADTKFVLGVTEGYFYGDSFEKLVKSGKIVKNVEFVEDNRLNFQKLIAKRIDGLLIDAFAGVNLMKAFNAVDKIERYPIEVYSCSIFVAFSRKSVAPEVVDLFNQELENIRKDGAYKRIVEKYLDTN